MSLLAPYGLLRRIDLGMGLGLQLEAVASLESGGLVVGGTQVDIGPNDAIVLAETDSARSVAWMQRHDTPGRDGHVSLWRTPASNRSLPNCFRCQRSSTRT